MNNVISLQEKREKISTSTKKLDKEGFEAIIEKNRKNKEREKEERAIKNSRIAWELRRG